MRKKILILVATCTTLVIACNSNTKESLRTEKEIVGDTFQVTLSSKPEFVTQKMIEINQLTGDTSILKSEYLLRCKTSNGATGKTFYAKYDYSQHERNMLLLSTKLQVGQSWELTCVRTKASENEFYYYMSSLNVKIWTAE